MGPHALRGGSAMTVATPSLPLPQPPPPPLPPPPPPPPPPLPAIAWVQPWPFGSSVAGGGSRPSVVRQAPSATATASGTRSAGPHALRGGGAMTMAMAMVVGVCAVRRNRDF